AGRYESALGIIERGLKLHPKDGRFPDLLTAVARNWVETTHAEKGKEGAMAVVTKLEELGKNHPDLRPAARRAAYWLVIELREAGKPEEAEALLSAKIPVVKGEKDAKEILRDVYDHWAGALLDKGDYRGAFGVYLKALDKLPDDPVMIAHLAYVVHRWLGAVEKAEGADKMKELIVQLRKEHPKLKDFIGLTPAAAWAGIKVLRDAGQYADALDALDRFADLLSKSDDVRKMYRIVYDDWAADFTKKKDPAFAVDVYEMALRRFPSDTHVWHNLGVTIQDWALALQADGREGEAKAVLLRALIRFPGVPNVAKAARNHLPLVVQDLRDAGKYTEALAVLDRHWDLLQDLHKDKADAERNEIGGGVYDIWAKTFIDKKDWDSAIAKYNEGLKVFKNSSLLKRNRQYCVDMKKRGK
ncbi:MAG TPA: hypothetical protein VKD90_28120, partial [Gemmataceae bacterium]|nr:hypothetical protein [Gemmataceae bacterium]